MKTEQSRLYLPGLHGLRFLAAFNVFLGHLEQAKSWVGLPRIDFPLSTAMADNGVMCFFVLSGFLITYLLMTEQERTGSINIRFFYTRRLLRIWPLYYFFTFLVFAIHPHLEFMRYPNLDVGLQTDFWPRLALYLLLSPHVAVSFFYHPGFGGVLWSVGVEEYFYLGWPHIIKNFRAALPCLLLGLIGLFITLRLTAENPHLVAFLSYFRVDAMAIGGLGAWLFLKKRSWAALFFRWDVQLVAYFFAVKHQLFVSNYGSFTPDILSIVYLTLIMNVALNPKSPLKLENRCFRYLGEISYGFYVFHWMLNVFCINTYLRTSGIENDTVRNAVLFVVCFSLTTLVASLSYYLVERRFLRLKPRFAPIISGLQSIQPTSGLPAPSLLK